MPRIVGITFNKKGRIYNFDAVDYHLELDEEVIVETEKGYQFGFVTTEIKEIAENEYSLPLKEVVRIATQKDKRIYKSNLEDANKALNTARDIVEELGLDMRLLDASYTFDRKQLLFNFIADERVDFRELAKRLAQIYKTRIELRQIGIRDKAKEIGGLGPCGRVLCCHTFLTDLTGVTINMAKNQLLALNPTKINGVCGRLLCCLNYEDIVYTKLREKLPDIGDNYKDKNVSGKIVDMNVLQQKIYVDDGKTITMVDLSNGKNK